MGSRVSKSSIDNSNLPKAEVASETPIEEEDIDPDASWPFPKVNPTGSGIDATSITAAWEVEDEPEEFTEGQYVISKKLLIFGYIRECEIDIDMNIPKDIITVFVSFCSWDGWDTAETDEGINIQFGTIIRSTYEHGPRTAKLGQEVSEGIHVWKLQINQLGYSWCIFAVKDVSQGITRWNQYGYGYVVNKGYKIGSRWLDTTNNILYICIDDRANNAVWVQKTQ